jgi:hypothetical protein
MRTISQPFASTTKTYRCAAIRNMELTFRIKKKEICCFCVLFYKTTITIKTPLYISNWSIIDWHISRCDIIATISRCVIIIVI